MVGLSWKFYTECSIFKKLFLKYICPVCIYEYKYFTTTVDALDGTHFTFYFNGLYANLIDLVNVTCGVSSSFGKLFQKQAIR